MPHLTTHLFYCRGAVLIMGGVTLNVFVAAIFYEPVERHMIRVPRLKKTLDDIEEEDIGIVLKFESVDESNGDSLPNDCMSGANKQLMPHNSPPTQSNDIHSYNIVDEDPQFVRSASATVVQNFGKGHDEFLTSSSSRIRKVSTPVRQPQRNQTFTPGQLNSQSSLYAVPEGSSSNNKLERIQTIRNSSKSRLPRSSPSTSSFQYISTPYHGSTLSFQPKEFSSHLSLRSVPSGTGVNAACGSDGLLESSTKIQQEPSDNKRSKFFDLSLLKDPTYLVILISNSTNAIGYTNFIILLPAYGTTLGFDKSLAAYLISIVSATDLIGRIGGSALSDMGFIPKTWYFIGGLAISGVSLALLPFSTSYGVVGFWCAAFGLASGIYVGITAVIMADMLGTERLTSSYGISLFVNGILQLIGPPLCGLWFESAQKYNPLFHTLGLVLLAGASLWGFMPFINRQKSKESNMDADEE